MLSKKERMVFALALFVACIVLIMVSLAVHWDQTPDSHKEIILAAGYCTCALLMILAAAYSVWFVAGMRKEIAKETAEYNQRIANQFNVGACISPQNWLDVDDYRRLASGSRK